MKPSEFTLPFYITCLKQHCWNWRDTVTTTHIRDFHQKSETMLIQVAHERGGEFLTAFNRHSPQNILPFAGVPATETNTPTTNTPKPMKLELEIPDTLFQPIVDAIDRLTKALQQSKMSGGQLEEQVCKELEQQILQTATTGEATGTAAAPKGRGRPRKTETPAPEPQAEEPAVTEPAVEPTVENPAPEPEPEAPAAPAEPKPPSGADLAKKAEPLVAHPDLQKQLIAFKKEELKFLDPVRTMTDPALLRRFDAKLDYLLVIVNLGEIVGEKVNQLKDHPSLVKKLLDYKLEVLGCPGDIKLLDEAKIEEFEQYADILIKESKLPKDEV